MRIDHDPGVALRRGGHDRAGVPDILIGASTEEVLIPDLLMGSAGATTRRSVVARNGGIFRSTSRPARASRRLRGRSAAPLPRRRVPLRRVRLSAVPRRLQSHHLRHHDRPGGHRRRGGLPGSEGAWKRDRGGTSEDHCLVPSFQPTDGDTSMTPNKPSHGPRHGAATEEPGGPSKVMSSDRQRRAPAGGR
jgi:hypothetical protein